MELGIFSRTYEISDWEETCRRMQAHGIRYTQLNFSNAGLDTLPESVGSKDLVQIRRIADQYGIILDGLSGTFNMIDPDARRREQGCKQFQTQCQAARELGIPLISLCTGSRHPQSKWKWHDDNRKPDAWDDLLRSTEHILRYAEENQVILGVEPEISNIICTAQLARTYLDTFQSPYLKIVMDGANLLRPETVSQMTEVMDEAFALLGKDIVSAHAKDLVMEEGVSFVAAGCGVLDYPYYLKLLKTYGYEGSLMLHGLSEKQILQSKIFMEETMRQAGIL